MANASQTRRVETPLATLDARFDYDAARRSLRVHYAVRNASGAPLMTLDRGDGRHPAPTDAAAAPLVKQEDGGVTLSHRALPLPKPSPTVPRIALAARLEPGASREASFVAEIPQGAARARYCLGVAPFAADDFTAVDGAWRASFRVAETQTLLCTEWISL